MLAHYSAANCGSRTLNETTLDTEPTRWSYPVAVAEIPDTGGHYEISADAETRAAVAETAGLRELPQLDATFDLTRLGDSVQVRGTVRAKVGQTCVVTLEPLENEVSEDIDLLFAPPVDPLLDPEAARKSQKGEPPEPLEDGNLDLGSIATEFLILGLDPYPRKPDAELNLPKERDEERARPFAALAALKKPR
jgi:uncharacterized metal-binding protein YceD (DUF177 family)